MVGDEAIDACVGSSLALDALSEGRADLRWHHRSADCALDLGLQGICGPGRYWLGGGVTADSVGCGGGVAWHGWVDVESWTASATGESVHVALGASFFLDGDTQVRGAMDLDLLVPGASSSQVSPCGNLRVEDKKEIAPAALDVLLVIDDSCSMVEEQASLAEAFRKLSGELASSALDWRVGVITTDVDSSQRRGRLVSLRDGSRWVERGDVGLESAYADLVDVGTDGAAEEAPFEAMLLATVDPDPEVRVHNEGFRRYEADLYVLVVSDEDDQSTTLTPADIRDALVDYAGPGRTVRFGAISGPLPLGCRGLGGDAVASPRFLNLVSLLNGSWMSICEFDYSPVFDFLTSAPSQFITASQTPVLSSLRLSYRPAAVRAGWVLTRGVEWFWDANARAAVLDEAHAKEPAEVVLSYSVSREGDVVGSGE